MILEIYCKQDDNSISMIGISLGTNCWNLLKIILKLNGKWKSKFESIEVIPVTKEEYDLDKQEYIEQFFVDTTNKYGMISGILDIFKDKSNLITVQGKNNQVYSLSVCDGKVICAGLSTIESSIDVFDDKGDLYVATFEKRPDNYIFKNLEKDSPSSSNLKLLPLKQFIDDKNTFHFEKDRAWWSLGQVNNYNKETSMAIEKAREYIENKIKIDEELCNLYESSEGFEFIIDYVLSEIYLDKILSIAFEVYVGVNKVNQLVGIYQFRPSIHGPITDIDQLDIQKIKTNSADISSYMSTIDILQKKNAEMADMIVRMEGVCSFDPPPKWVYSKPSQKISSYLALIIGIISCVMSALLLYQFRSINN